MPSLQRHEPMDPARRADLDAVWADIEARHLPLTEGLSASLDAQETTPESASADVPTFADGHPLEVQSVFQRRAHAREHNARWAIVNAMWQEVASDELRKRAHRLGQCCCRPTIRLHPESGPRPSLARCRDRLCPLCSERRGRQAAHRTGLIVGKFNSPRFITLTLAHRTAPLSSEIDRLHGCLKLLRADKVWKSNVDGGIFGFEVTHNVCTQQWHVHVHAIVDGRYFPQPQLKAAWHEITGDSYIVDVRAVPDRRRAAKYIARYVAKPVDVTTWPPAAIREYAEAMHGRRLLQPFGKAHGLEVDDDQEETPEVGTSHLCDSGRLVRCADGGHVAAIRARDILARLSPDMAWAVGAEWVFRKPDEVPDAAEISFATHVCRTVGEHCDSELDGVLSILLAQADAGTLPQCTPTAIPASDSCWSSHDWPLFLSPPWPESPPEPSPGV